MKRPHTHTYTHTLLQMWVFPGLIPQLKYLASAERATLIYSRVVLSLVLSHVHTHRRARLHAHQPAVLHVVTTLLRVVDNVLHISQLQHRRQTRSLTARVLNWRWDGFHYAFPRFVSNNISQGVVVICQIRFLFRKTLAIKVWVLSTNVRISYEGFLFYRWCGG